MHLENRGTEEILARIAALPDLRLVPEWVVTAREARSRSAATNLRFPDHVMYGEVCALLDLILVQSAVITSRR